MLKCKPGAETAALGAYVKAPTDRAAAYGGLLGTLLPAATVSAQLSAGPAGAANAGRLYITALADKMFDGVKTQALDKSAQKPRPGRLAITDSTHEHIYEKILPHLLAAAALAFCGTALAQKAGTFSASIGFTTIAPSVNSGNLSAPSLPNTKVDVNSNSQITGAVNYMVTDNLAVHVPLGFGFGFGFKHEISGAGAIAGVGKLVDAKALPITLIGQYRFLDINATFRPYVGAGVSYVKFYNEKGTGASFESRLAPTLQIGGTYNINENGT